MDVTSDVMPPCQSLTSSFFTFYSVSDDMLGLSFQLASLEENAAIYLWVIYFLVLLASCMSSLNLLLIFV